MKKVILGVLTIIMFNTLGFQGYSMNEEIEYNCSKNVNELKSDALDILKQDSSDISLEERLVEAETVSELQKCLIFKMKKKEISEEDSKVVQSLLSLKLSGF